MTTTTEKFVLRKAGRDLQAIYALRRAVFIDEQQVPEAEEWDGRDDDAVHFFIEDHADQVVATGRLLHQGRIGRIGRMAVHRDMRGQGLGAMLMRALISHAQKNRLDKLVLDAQVHAIAFYQKFAFVVVSDVFMDAGIAHRRMQRTLKTS